MYRTFVTSDTHGCYDELKKCLDEANFDYDNDKLIHCGDVIDRGPKSKEVVELLLSIKNLIAIRGNHDKYFLDAILTGVFIDDSKGGQNNTRDSYRNKEITDDIILSIPHTHKEFFKNQLTYYIDEDNRFFCHAGYSRDYEVSIQTEQKFLWDRNLMIDIMYYNDDVKRIDDINEFKRVYFGHTPTLKWENDNGENINTPIYKGQFVQIDTGGCFKHGKISLLDISDDENHILYQN